MRASRAGSERRIEPLAATTTHWPWSWRGRSAWSRATARPTSAAGAAFCALLEQLPLLRAPLGRRAACRRPRSRRHWRTRRVRALGRAPGMHCRPGGHPAGLSCGRRLRLAASPGTDAWRLARRSCASCRRRSSSSTSTARRRSPLTASLSAVVSARETCSTTSVTSATSSARCSSRPSTRWTPAGTGITWRPPSSTWRRCTSASCS